MIEIKRRIFGFDRIIIALAGLLAIGAVATIYFYDGIFGSDGGHGSGQRLGEISYLENDTRHKDSKSLGWLNAREHQKIYLNDSVFTGGHSQSTIKLDHGDRVDMGENTLIVFSKVDGLDIPNLSGGNFKLFVNDKMKVSIGGELTEIEGKGSEVQIYVKPGVKPQVRLLKGQAKIKPKANSEIALDLGKVAVLETPTPNPQVASAPPVAPPSAPPEIRAKPTESTYQHTVQLYDLYDRNGAMLVQRAEPRSFVAMSIPLSCESKGSVQKVFVQHSNRGDFATSSLSFEAPQTGFVLKNAFLGDNFWRVSLDGNTWGDVNRFDVSTRFLPTPAPKMKWKSRKISLTGDHARIAATILQNENLKYILVEKATNKDFTDVQITWLTSRNLYVELTDPGEYYFRARGVSENLELTEYSPVTTVRMARPAPQPAAPILANAKTDEQAPPVEEPKDQEEERKPASVDSKVVTKTEEKEFKNPYRLNHSLWLGAGPTYMTYREDDGGTNTHVNFESLTGPSLYLDGRYIFSDSWRFLGSIRNSPGQAKSTGSISVSGSNYNWTTVSAEGMFLPANWNFTLFNRQSTVGIRFGTQYHSMPFLAQTSVNQMSVENDPVTMASAGVQLDTRIANSTNFELFMRYQYPLLSSSSLTVDPGLTFDGSVGLMTMLTPTWSFGGFWYGQMQDYSFSHGAGGSTTTGTQQVFFSSVEARMGYIFP